MNAPDATSQAGPTAPSLFFQQSGAGSPLLLIHGLMVSGEMYQTVLPALGATHRLIVPDLRGHGRSGVLPGPYSIEQLARDLGDLLQDLKLEGVDVLGYSQGGAIAQQLAHAYPGRVRRLVLACTFANNMLSRRERFEGKLAPWMVRLLGLKVMAKMASTSGGGPSLPPETERWFQGMITSNHKSHMVAAVEAMEAFDSRPWLNQISCPTLVIAGAQDEAVPLAHAHMLAEGIPNAQLRVVDGAGHTLIWTHTKIFLQIVEEFLVPAT